MTTQIRTMTSDETSIELDRHAFNATFHELGLLWYWDIDTYEDLCKRADDARSRTRLYLTSAQAHLLKAYDADFLVDNIVRRMSEVRRSVAGRAPRAIAFDRAASCRGVVGF